MNTFNKMWGVRTPAEAKAKIAQQVAEAGIKEPKNLEEQAISLVGYDIYEKLIKGYTSCGAEVAEICLHLSLNACRYALLMITTISMIAGRASPLAGTHR